MHGPITRSGEEEEELPKRNWLDFDPIPEVEYLIGTACRHTGEPVHLMGNYAHMFLEISDLPTSHCHYLAVMAAARHRCLSLMDMHRRRFLEKGGSTIWILGVDWSVMRYRKVDYLNRMLCHRPWVIHWKNLAALIARRPSDEGPSFYSIESLHQAVGIMSMTHAMCTVVCSLGLERRCDLSQTEIDFLNIDDFDYWQFRPSKRFRVALDRKATPVEELICSLKKTQRGRMRPAAKMCAMTSETIESLMSAPAATFSAHRKNYSPTLLLGNVGPAGENIEELEPECNYPIYTHDRTFGYIDFRKRPEKDIQPFSITEFGWDHAYNTMNEYTDTLTSRLDSMFANIRKLTTTSSISSDDSQSPEERRNQRDTAVFREAIWNYTQGLYGVRVDDYDYSKINRVLDRGTKTFIKIAACYPHKLTTEFTNAMPGLRVSEKVHVVMMIAMARFQASMFHYTRAVSNYNTMCMSRKGWRRPLD
ncbi:unnamed protein product [Caenorhabditis sp. 36 PRJEB53466]|nr:unnamed protein product [Caenorhabditis sp. 36 PRJEB53466]